MYFCIRIHNKEFLPSPQCCPCQPFVQLHTYEPLLLMHVPLCLHKSVFWHSSTSTKEILLIISSGFYWGGGRVKKCSFGWVICICLYWAVDFDIFFLPFKQFWSFHPVVQSQINDPTVLTQVPLFWQGENWHSSKSKIIRDNTGWYSYNKIKL